MPSIPEERYRPTRSEVIIDLLKSIAMEETALSHLVNAEAEKVQAFVGKKRDFPFNPSVKEIMAFNAQVFKIMDIVVMKEWLLLRKMKDVLEMAAWVQSDDGMNEFDE